MKLVLSGPMAHLPDSNFPAFEVGAHILRRAGYEVLTPVVLCPPDVRAQAKRMGADFRSTAAYRSLMRECLKQVLEADGMAQLDDWASSSGAKAEFDLARMVGMPIRHVHEWVACGKPQPTTERPVRWVGHPAYEPKRFYGGDAGFDLVCARTVRIAPGEFKDVDCGISIELPEGVWAMITGRSSTLRKRKLLVAQGIIDNGWRGPLFAGVQNMGHEHANVLSGKRIAQLIPFPLVAANLVFERVATLGEGDRGDRGFGSTDG